MDRNKRKGYFDDHRHKFIKNKLWSYSSSAMNPGDAWGTMVFRGDGRIGGYFNKNECLWEYTEDSLNLLDKDRTITSKFKFSNFSEDGWRGDFIVSKVDYQHVLSVNRGLPVDVPFNGIIAKIAEEGRFYFSHFKGRDGIYQNGQIIKVYPDLFIEPTAALPLGSMYNGGVLIPYLLGLREP